MLKYQVFQQCIKHAAQQSLLIRARMGFLSCLSWVVSGPSNTQETRSKGGFWTNSSCRLIQASGTRTEREAVPWGGMSPAVHCFMGPIAAVPSLELIWGRLCRQAAALCINTSFQVDLHTPADPRMFLWNFSGIFTLSVFRPPVERLSWGCVSSVVRGTLNLVRADQIQPLSLDLIENFGFWSWSVSGNAQALVCASVIYYSLSSLLADLFLFLRSYLLA